MQHKPLPEVPNQLTDAEARKLMEEVAAEVRALNDQIVRNNDRAEQGEKNKKELMARANQHFGKPNAHGENEVEGGEDGVLEILKDRKIENASRVRQFMQDFDAARRQVAALPRASMR